MVGYASAIGSHVGMVRSNNQDSGYAGERLFLVADGMGGHAGGDVASALATRSIAKIDAQPDDGERPELNDPRAATRALADQLLQSNRKLRATVGDRPELAGLGTTFTGFVTVGDSLALAHIGDSRLYLLRGNELTQITRDHTFVQRLVDSGQITEEEAKTHPRRSVLMRVLGDVESAPEIDTEVLHTEPGDLWLLCSDGLCGYVEESAIERTLRRRTSLQGAVDALIDRALAQGAPDNVTVVLIETLTEPRADAAQHEPTFVGSAANDEVQGDAALTTVRTRLSPMRLIGRRAQPVAESHFEPRVDEYLKELIAETKRRNRRRRAFGIIGLLAIIGALVGALALGYQWTQSRYFVGTDGNTVIIYRGVQQSIGSFSLNSVAEDTGIPFSELDGNERRAVERTLSASSLEEARDIVLRLEVTTE